MHRIASTLQCFVLCVALVPRDAGGRTIRICYTTELHGNLMPCACPIRPLGGLARRIGWIDSLRAAPDAEPILMLDAGESLPRAQDFPRLDDSRRDAILPLYQEAAKRIGYDAISGIDLETNQAKILVRNGIHIAVVALAEGIDPETAAPALRSLGRVDLTIALCSGDLNFAASAARRIGAKVAVASRGACLGGPFWRDGVLILGPGRAGRYVGLAQVDIRPDGAVHALDVRLRAMDGSVSADPVWRDRVERTVLDIERVLPGAFVAGE